MVPDFLLLNASWFQLQKLGKWRSIVRGLELSIAYCILNLTYSVSCELNFLTMSATANNSL